MPRLATMFASLMVTWALVVAPAAQAAPVPPIRPVPAPASAEEALAMLEELTVAEQHPMTGYSRARFRHWASAGQHCDVREIVLIRDGDGVDTDGECKAVAGVWVSAYDGKTITTKAGVDIDHMVPLAAAWRAGADTWTDKQRAVFANDLTSRQLIAVSAASNRSKGDQEPHRWMPPSTDYHCTYVIDWTVIKKLFVLNVTAAEKSTLSTILTRCAAAAAA